MEAFFLRASSANLFPSFFLPRIAKKMSFFLTSFKLILACPRVKFVFNFLSPDDSLIRFNFKLFDKFKFFNLIAFKIIFLSEK